MRGMRGTRPSSRPKKSDGGFTYVEVVVAVLILALIAGAVTGGTVHLYRLYEKFAESVRSHTALLRADDALRSLTARCRPPWWLTDSGFTVGTEEVVIPFLDGDSKRQAVVRWNDPWLGIDLDGTVLKFGPFGNVRFGPIGDRDNPAGFRVTVGFDGVKESAVDCFLPYRTFEEWSGP